jgi:hypothetical protein
MHNTNRHKYYINIFGGYFLYNLNIFVSTDILQTRYTQGFMDVRPDWMAHRLSEGTFETNSVARGCRISRYRHRFKRTGGFRCVFSSGNPVARHLRSQRASVLNQISRLETIVEGGDY